VNLLRSVAARLAVLVVAFSAVPVVLAGQFLKAEDAKRAVMLRMAQEEGLLIADGLRIGIERADHPLSVAETRALVERMDTRDSNMRLLLRPLGDPSSIYLIATAPPLTTDQFEEERRQLATSGIFAYIPRSCDGATPLDLRYSNASYGDEILSSITPIASAAGCWAIVTSHSGRDVAGSLLGRPYWRAPEVTLATAIYGLLALFAISLFGGLWRSLVRFGQQAQAVSEDGATSSFAASNRIPELNNVAEQLDRMVASLKAAAVAARRAAEDNAHALKTPIATIAQSLEPIRRGLADDDARGRRALQLIEQSVVRLDALVTAARRMDEANATLLHPPHQRVDLTAMARNIVSAYAEIAAERTVRIAADIEDGCAIWAGTELMETVMENLLDNAISFSPAGSAISVRLRRVAGRVVLSIEDQGPGASPEIMAAMFDRYVSHRPGTSTAPGEQHFGIGLWVVRRNVESVGGEVRAENVTNGGLRMTVALPEARE
jgi:two-component system sensor histidine kinase ChvG